MSQESNEQDEQESLLGRIGGSLTGAVEGVIERRREAARLEREQEEEAERARVAERDRVFAIMQKTCPIPMERDEESLPGDLKLFNDEFLLSVGKDWGLSTHRLTLTTHRLIHSHGIITKEQEVVYLTDIRDVDYHKELLHHGELIVETAGGKSLTGLPHASNAKELRDQLLALVHWARDRPQIVASAEPIASAPVESEPPPSTDKYDRLKKLAELKQMGALSDSEFEAEKAKVLADS